MVIYNECFPRQFGIIEREDEISCKIAAAIMSTLSRLKYQLKMIHEECSALLTVRKIWLVAGWHLNFGSALITSNTVFFVMEISLT